MIATLIAYVLSGIYGVILDYRQPIDNRPAYIRRGGTFRVIGAVLLWLPIIFMILLSLRTIQRKDMGIVALFITLSAVGHFLR
jgi:amino acid transporter